MTLRGQIGKDERVIWEGGKSKKVSVLEGIFNPMLPIALIWGLFDFSFIGVSMSSMGSDDSNLALITLVPFFAIHLLPVWMYLGGCLLSGIKAKHTNYMITDKNIYIQSGVFSVTTTVKPITDISHVTVNQGLFDRVCGTGDVICECNHMDFAGNGHSTSHGTHISNIEDYETVFSMLRDVQTKINEK